MNVDELADLLDRPETHRKILGAYHGPYSLGVARAPDPRGGHGFLLRVEGQGLEAFPKSVNIDGHEIPVTIKGDFTAPRPH